MAGDSKGNLASFDLQKKLDDLVAQIASEEPDLTKKLDAANGKAATTAPAVPPTPAPAADPPQKEDESGLDDQDPSSGETIQDAGEDALEAIEKASASAKALEEELAEALGEDAESDSESVEEDSKGGGQAASGGLEPDVGQSEKAAGPSSEPDGAGGRGRVLAEDAIGSKLDELLQAANQPLTDPAGQEEIAKSPNLIEDTAGDVGGSEAAAEGMERAELEARQALETALIGSDSDGGEDAAEAMADSAVETSPPAETAEATDGETELAAAERDDVPAGTFADISALEETVAAADVTGAPAVAAAGGEEVQAAESLTTPAKAPVVSEIQDAEAGEPGSKTKQAMLGALRASGLFGTADAGSDDSEPAKVEPKAAQTVEAPLSDESSTIEDLDQALAEEADDEPAMEGDFQSVDDLLGEDEPQASPEIKLAVPQVAAAVDAPAPKPVRIESDRRNITKAMMIWLAGVDWKQLQQKAADCLFKTCAWLNRPSERLGLEGQKIIGYAAAITAANAALISLWRILL